MRDQESSELLVEGYQKAVRAKLLHIFNETFYSIPTDSANCCYLNRLILGSSADRCEPAKKGGPVVVCRPPLR